MLKKILMGIALLLGVGVYQESQATNIVIKAMLNVQESQKFYDSYLQNIRIQDNNTPLTYHVTLGFIENVADADKRALDIFLQNQIKQNPKWIQHLTFEVYHADLLGPHLVIKPYNEESFKALNQALAASLKKFKGANNKAYTFNAFTSTNYIPHLTVGTGTQTEVETINRSIDINAPEIKVQSITTRVM